MWSIVKNGLFDSYFCNAVIQKAETIGFEQATTYVDAVEAVDTSIRNNSRVIFTDGYLAKYIHDALDRIVIPQKLNGKVYNGVSDVFRVYKYLPEQFFKPHKDNSIETAKGETQITVLIYLNNCDGGHTVLYPYGEQQEWAKNSVAPSIGKVLLFEQGILHSGEPVLSGCKYVLRTDLFYK